MRAALSILLLMTATVPALAQDAEPKPLMLIDLRPPEEKSGHALTELTGKCNKEVFRIADVASDPSKLDVLLEDMRSYLAENGHGKSFTVLNWSIYYNKQVQKSGGGLSNIGIQGYSVPGKEKKRKAGSLCAKKESAGGWYEADELESVYYPLISEFEGTFSGKLVRVRVVHSPRNKLEGEFTGGAVDSEHLLATVHETAEAIANQLIPQP